MFGAEAVDFAALFEQEPTPCALISPDLVISDANGAYVSTTGLTREQLIGHHVRDAFPADACLPGLCADGHQSLLTSMERALATGRPDSSAILRFDASGDGVTTARFFSPMHIPVKGPDGSVSVLLQRIEDVTEFVLAAA